MRLWGSKLFGWESIILLVNSVLSIVPSNHASRSLVLRVSSFFHLYFVSSFAICCILLARILNHGYLLVWVSIVPTRDVKFISSPFPCNNDPTCPPNNQPNFPIIPLSTVVSCVCIDSDREMVKQRNITCFCCGVRIDATIS